jgi:hypothetical protein
MKMAELQFSSADRADIDAYHTQPFNLSPRYFTKHMFLFMYSMTALSANSKALLFKRKKYIFSHRIEVSIDIFQFKIYMYIVILVYTCM